MMHAENENVSPKNHREVFRRNRRRQRMDTKKYLQEIERVIEAGPYHDNWDSLAQYRVPKWYQDAKYGIFIHWGV